MGGHSRDEIIEEIEKNHAWIKDVNVVKMKEYTHVMKLEFQTVEEADRVLENGMLFFQMSITKDQITRDKR